MRFITVAAASLAAPVSANGIKARQKSLNDIGAVGLLEPGSFGSSSTPEEAQSFVAAGRQPNTTSSANFNIFFGNLSTADSDSNWTWRVNISEVDVPNKEDTRVINSQWELEWPGGGSLQSFLAKWDVGGRDGGGLCIKAAEFVLPSNITSRYSASDQGNCSAILGDECIQALRNSSSSGNCADPFSPADLQMCTDTLAISEDGTHVNYGLLVDSTLNQSIQSGEAFWYHTSGKVPTANISRPLAAAETRLNMLILQEVPKLSKGALVAYPLCQVIDPSASSGTRSSTVALSLWASGLLATAWMLFLS